MNVFFYKNNYYKNNFYKNMFLYYNFINLNLISNNNVNINYFLLNYFLLSNTTKLNSNQFYNQYEDLINLNFIDPENKIVTIPDDVKDEFNLVFFKKTKFFFFKNFLKNYSTLNTNNLINLIAFTKFNSI